MRVLLLMVVAFAVGCGRSTPEMDALPEAGQPAPLASDPTISALMALARAARCGPSAACGVSAFSAACPELAPAEFSPWWSDLEDVDAGLMRLDEEALRRCIRRFETECGIPVRCSEVFVGSVPLDGQCRSSSNCVAGLFCSVPSSACAGTCRPLVDDGALAADDTACVDPNGAVQLPNQTGVACHRTATSGQSCVLRSGLLLNCAVGLTCRSGTCQPPPGIGDACALDGRCGFGAACDNGVCVRLARAGEPCGACLHGLECRNGRCVGLSSQPGEVCQFDCQRPSRCWGGRCLEQHGLGETCTSELECEAPLRCLASGRCGLPRRAGQSCTASTFPLRSDCEPLNDCREGVCQRRCP